MSSYYIGKEHNDNELVSKAKAGDSIALSLLIEKYSAYVLKKANSFKNLCRIDTEDLYQEGIIGLVSSIYSFDETYGTKFSTYSATVYTRRMLSVIRKSTNDISNCVDSFTSIDDVEIVLQHPSPEDAVLYDEELGEIIDFAKTNFSKTEQKVFKLLLLGVSYSEISEIIDSNIKSVDNAVQRIRKKLKIYRNQ